jgi:hypothetical protein
MTPGLDYFGDLTHFLRAAADVGDAVIVWID